MLRGAGKETVVLSPGVKQRLTGKVLSEPRSESRDSVGWNDLEGEARRRKRP